MSQSFNEKVGKKQQEDKRYISVTKETIRNKEYVTESERCGDRILIGSLFLDKKCN